MKNQYSLYFYITLSQSNNRNFHSSFYSKFNCLEYSISDDAVFCFPCRQFHLMVFSEDNQLAMLHMLKKESSVGGMHYSNLLNMV